MTFLLAPEETKLITGEDLLAIGDLEPCELVEGRIIYMSPTGGEHGYVEFNLGGDLRAFVRKNQLGWVMGGEVGIYTHRDPDTVRGADVAFLSKTRFPHGVPQGFLETAPDLVVEVLSPSNTWDEIRTKIREYFAAGVTWVWIVEPDHRVVLVYSSPTRFVELLEGDILKGEGILKGFEVRVSTFFEK